MKKRGRKNVSSRPQISTATHDPSETPVMIFGAAAHPRWGNVCNSRKADAEDHDVDSANAMKAN
jgi:hypothetical protein